MLRADRDRNGGSVCIYVRCRVKYISDLVPTDFEAVCVEINLANAQSFIISSVYRPPCSTNEVFTNVEKIIKLIDDECI